MPDGPAGGKDEVVVFGRVWWRAGVAPAGTAEQEAIGQRETARELPVPGRAALPVGAAAARTPPGSRSRSSPSGRAGAGRREQC